MAKLRSTQSFFFKYVSLAVLSMVGTIGVSAYAIIANMNIIVIAILTGIGQGFQPLISEFYATK